MIQSLNIEILQITNTTSLLFSRVVILVIVMLIIVPLLNVKESDNTQTLAVQLVQNMAVYNFRNTTLYAVRQDFSLILNLPFPITSNRNFLRYYHQRQ